MHWTLVKITQPHVNCTDIIRIHDTIKYLTTMIEKRIDPVTGREQLWVKPDGLPGLWVTRGYCDRCDPYKECLGFLSLSDEEWAIVEVLIADTKSTAEVKKRIEGLELKCEKSLI